MFEAADLTLLSIRELCPTGACGILQLGRCRARCGQLTVRTLPLHGPARSHTMKYTPIILLAMALSACSPEHEPEAAVPSSAMSDAIEDDAAVNAKIRAVHNACQAAFEHQVRAGGQSVLDYQYGPTGPLATRTSTGWKASIDATLTQTGRVGATCFTDDGYRVLDLQR